MSVLTLEDLGLAAEQASELPISHAQMVAATLDVPFQASQPLPLLWHWAFFNLPVDTKALGDDGHPKRASRLLDEFPRRMWVGGEVKAKSQLHADVPATRRSRLIDYRQKKGASGDFLIVTLEHLIEQCGVEIIAERQDVIYRGPDGVTTPPGPAAALPPTQGWRHTVTPTHELLFRFSAITFNSHRIHYDLDYATQVEHYPSLVVQGPLTAMLLSLSATEKLCSPIHTFSFRARQPLFVQQELIIDVEIPPGTPARSAELTATRFDGTVAMTAEASI